MSNFNEIAWENKVSSTPLVDLLSETEINFIIYALELADQDGFVNVGNLHMSFPDLDSFVQSITKIRGEQKV